MNKIKAKLMIVTYMTVKKRNYEHSKTLFG
jgi:hypothetical protein